MRLLPLLVAIALLLARPAPASALSCAALSVRLMSPASGVKAPADVKPIVEIASVDGDPMKNLKLSLVGPGDKKVATTQTVVGVARVRAVQLAPARPLADGHYEVRWSLAGQTLPAGAFDVASREKPHVSHLGPFLLGSLFDGKVKDGWNPTPRHVRYLKLTSMQKDPLRLVLAVWIDRGALDYSKPPLLITDQPPPIILGESPGACPYFNYVVPADKGKLRLGLKVIEPSGKMGRPHELTIDLGR